MLDCEATRMRPLPGDRCPDTRAAGSGLGSPFRKAGFPLSDGCGEDGAKRRLQPCPRRAAVCFGKGRRGTGELPDEARTMDLPVQALVVCRAVGFVLALSRQPLGRQHRVQRESHH